METVVDDEDDLIIDSFVAITQRFINHEDDQIQRVETDEHISLLNRLSSIMEHEARVFEEAMNNPFDEGRESKLHSFYSFTQTLLTP
jgi:hypothetical protein